MWTELLASAWQIAWVDDLGALAMTQLFAWVIGTIGLMLAAGLQFDGGLLVMVRVAYGKLMSGFARNCISCH